MTTHCIVHRDTDPFFNLAMEEVLFDRSSQTADGYILLWRNRPTVVVGRFQNTVGEVNARFLKEHGVSVVRRTTGGGAVYHDLGNLNYTFILPVRDRDSKGLDFALYTRPLLEYLESIGVHAELTGRNDLTIEGKKFSGNAQHVSRDTMLHHGTILFNTCLEDVASSLSVDPEKFRSKGVTSVRSRVTNVAPHLPKPMSMEDFIDGLMEFFAAPFGGFIRGLSDEETEVIQTLRDEKYATWDWVWGNSPPFSLSAERRFEKGKIQLYLDVRDGIIGDVAIRGDFFSEADPQQVEKALKGVSYRRNSVEKALASVAVSRHLLGISPEDLIDLVME
ncbi:MAG: lipoate--protein ligase [Dethiosulfovibrio peptidovorans]|nr:MAG: lipoate--protein ligase [Dethiosulfovibrio peptidovorans]